MTWERSAGIVHVLVRTVEKFALYSARVSSGDNLTIALQLMLMVRRVDWVFRDFSTTLSTTFLAVDNTCR